MTLAHAKILAGMLSKDAIVVLRVYRDRHHANVTEEGVKEVVEHKLIEEVENLLDGKKIWVLTSDGKKVVQFIPEGA